MTHAHDFSDSFAFEATLTVDPAADAVTSAVAHKGLAPAVMLPPNACFAESLEQFSRISAAQKNILIHFWAPPWPLHHHMESRPFADLPEMDVSFRAPDLQATIAATNDELALGLLSALAPAINRAHELCGGKHMRMTLGKLRDRMCPLFHVDRLLLRMICTLRGPGTEWLDDREVQRANLGKGSNAAIVTPGATIYQLGQFQIGLLKGEEFAGSRRRGVVHRSPAVASTSDGRWYFRLDITA